MANQDRVKLRVYTDSNGSFQLITSTENAELFRNTWREIITKPVGSIDKTVSITGTVDHCDSNTVDLEILAETINAVELVEVKGL